MKVHYYKFLMLFFFVYSISFAQGESISGTVTDDKGLPLPGVNVLIKNTNNGTQTDFDGNYTISASRGAVISFSYVGFETKEIVVNEKTTINAQLSTSSSELEEVVIVGFGTTTEKKTNPKYRNY
ncbi:carboxypeptidase-like regulatory domain-containing protein [Aquimarina spinulae]|uniref:carboxypeptidase-like regulatory domain-containing protein n=1 Tax=Aquimarina spinulae TaxID=1192023 RepID=UPI0020C45077|nr:carboxypeptidase-like regulatory domain-containing protein [Aquimarina spinulae]